MFGKEPRYNEHIFAVPWGSTSERVNAMFSFVSALQSAWHFSYGCFNCFLPTLSSGTEIFQTLPSLWITGTSSSKPSLHNVNKPRWKVAYLSSCLFHRFDWCIFLFSFFCSRLFSIMTYFFFFYNILLGLFSCFGRILKGMFLGVVFLSRIDRTSLMQGFQSWDQGM